MATRCAHYAHLALRFRELCAKFIDAEVAAEDADLAGFIPDLDKIAAFRLLLHAEVETFLEEKAKEKLLALERDIKSAVWHRNNPQILSLYLLTGNYISKSDFIADDALRDHFFQLIGSARKKIKENNGIKEQSFIFLSVIAGKSLDEIDVTTSAMLNSFGKNRGDVAHNSAVRSKTLLSPFSERKNGEAIVYALSSYFDLEE